MTKSRRDEFVGLGSKWKLEDGILVLSWFVLDEEANGERGDDVDPRVKKVRVVSVRIEEYSSVSGG